MNVLFPRRSRIIYGVLFVLMAGFMFLLPTAGLKTSAAETLSTSKMRLWKGQSASIYVKGNDKNRKITWKSANKSVATVSKGRVTAVLGGTTVIKAKVGGKTLRCKVYVRGLSRNRITMNPGMTYKIRLRHANASKWTSSDSSVAKVSSSGKVKAVSSGYAKISCKTGKKTLTCKIYVPELNEDSLYLDKGDSFQLEKSGTPANASWKSGNKSVAKVSKSGRVTALSAGKTTITCTCGKAKLKCQVAVAGTNVVTAQSTLPASRSHRKKVTVQGSFGPVSYYIYNQGSSKNKSTVKGLKAYMPYHGCATCATVTVLGGLTGKEVLPAQMIETIEKKVFGASAWKSNYNKNYKAQRPLSLCGITKIFAKYGIQTKYVRSFTDTGARMEILSHLKSGNPVIFVVSKKNRKTGKNTGKWTSGYHNMAMLGITDKGKVIVADSANRASFGSSQRIKLVNFDDILPYMFSCTKVKNSNYWSGKKKSGGYVLVYSYKKTEETTEDSTEQTSEQTAGETASSDQESADTVTEGTY